MAGRERTTKISYVRLPLEGSLTSQRNGVVPYKILPPVIESVKQVVTSRLKLFTAQLTSNEMH
jgi:hypothetical protein